MFLDWPVRPSVRSSGQISLPRYLLNGLNNFDITDREYTLASFDDLIICSSMLC